MKNQKSQNLRAIKIDAERQEVYEVLLTDDFRDIYKAIGLNCTTFECPQSIIRDGRVNTIYVDEEALLTYFGEPKGKFYFELKPSDSIGQYFKYSNPYMENLYVNNAIILGVDMETGDSISTNLLREEVADLIDGWGEIAVQ